MGINLHKLNKKLGLEHCVVRREPGFVPSGYFVHDVMVEKHVNVIIIIIIIIITKIDIFTNVPRLGLLQKDAVTNAPTVNSSSALPFCLQLRWRRRA